MLQKIQKKLYNLLRRIPKGKVVTYQSLAQAMGRPGAWRWVGNLLAQNQEPRRYPCYKVVRSDGRLGGYSGGSRLKKKLLEREGVVIQRKRVKNLEKYLFVLSFRARP